MADIRNGQNTIDVEDLRKELEALRSSELDENDEEDSERLEELEGLEDFVNEIGQCGGNMLIHDSHMTEYAQQLAEDIGAISDSGEWPATRIDWDAAVTDMQQDYHACNWGSETYWIRS